VVYGYRLVKWFVLGIKKDARTRLNLWYWWSGGESNPRPKNLHPRYYMLSRLFV